MGPDGAKHLRNIAIVVVLALAVWRLPGGAPASRTIGNLLTVIFMAGLLFFGYRMYMEHRTTLMSLEDRTRALLYGSLALAAFTLIATSTLWSQGGFGALIWLLLLGLAVWGMVRVIRAHREY